MNIQQHAHTILLLAKANSFLRSKDLRDIPRTAFSRLVQSGELTRIAPGLYSLPERPISENENLLEVALKTKNGIFCLLTALRFHQLTTQNPFEVWLAIPNKAKPPILEHLTLRTIRFSGKALTEGIETHLIDGVQVRVYSISKTIADCFKFRNKIGLDIAIEALQEAWKEKRVQADQLWHDAKICRVEKIMLPYLESLN